MGDEFWLDNSKIETYHLCPQKYAYRFEEHLVPIERKRDSALMFGGAIHKALEALYRGNGFDLVECPLGPCARCQNKPIQRLVASFLKNYADDPNDPKEIRTVDRGLDLLGQYLLKWRREPFKVLEVEVPFELHYATIDFCVFNYVGRIDLIVEQDDMVFPVDHKTTTRFGMVFDSSFKLSGQFTGYMKATEVHTQRDCYTALANAMRITTRIEDSSFARIYTSRTPEEFDRWEANTYAAARQILEMRAAGFWPRHAPFACGAYNRVCDYYPLCISGEQTREHLKRTAYEVRPWEPRKDTDD